MNRVWCWYKLQDSDVPESVRSTRGSCFFRRCSEQTRFPTVYPCLAPRGRRLLSLCNYRDYFRPKANLHLIDKQDRFFILADDITGGMLVSGDLHLTCIAAWRAGQSDICYHRHEIYHAQDRVPIIDLEAVNFLHSERRLDCDKLYGKCLQMMACGS